MNGCILPSFLRPIASRYNTTVDTIRLKMTEYLMKNNLDSVDMIKDLSDVDRFLDNEFKNTPVYQETGNLTFEETYNQWEEMKEKTFDYKDEAINGKIKAESLWGKDAVALSRTKDGKYFLKVAEPKTIDGYTKEMLDILKSAPRNKEGKLLVRKNGPVSHLTEFQYAQVRTKAFKEWFGDWENDPQNASKVVDENGEPLVVYHASDNGNFTIFDPTKIGSKRSSYYGHGFYFSSNKEYANNFGSNTRAFFLNARNPYHSTNDAESQIEIENNNDLNWVHVISQNSETGEFYDDNIDELVIFSQNQVKSATDNNGEFNREDDNIYHKRYHFVKDIRRVSYQHDLDINKIEPDSRFPLYDTPLFQKALALSKQLGIRFEYKPLDYRTLGEYYKGVVSIGIGREDADFMPTLYHEMLHSVTSHILHADKSNLTKEQIDAVEILNKVYNLAKSKDINNLYGLTNIDEFVAELSNPGFRNYLKTIQFDEHKTLWDKIVEAFKMIFGNALDVSDYAVELIISSQASSTVSRETVNHLNNYSFSTEEKNEIYAHILDLFKTNPLVASTGILEGFQLSTGRIIDANFNPVESHTIENRMTADGFEITNEYDILGNLIASRYAKIDTSNSSTIHGFPKEVTKVTWEIGMQTPTVSYTTEKGDFLIEYNGDKWFLAKKRDNGRYYSISAADYADMEAAGKRLEATINKYAPARFRELVEHSVHLTSKGEDDIFKESNAIEEALAEEFGVYFHNPDSELSYTNNFRVRTYKGNWTRKSVEKYKKEAVFLFGDNTDDRLNTHHVPTSTQAVIRGLPNAIGIDTKKNRGTSDNSYFSDADFDAFKTQVDAAIQQAKDSGKIIVLPENGIGTGKAMLKEKAPKLFNYLQNQLNSLQQNGNAIQASNPRTIQYTPKGKSTQTYTITKSEDGGYHIFNKEGKEVFTEDSKDRRKIFANLAVREGRAVVVDHKNKQYVVNNRDEIISVTTGDLMHWGKENGDRRDILQAAHDKFNVTRVVNQVAEQPTIQQIESQLTEEDNNALEDEFGSRKEREERREVLNTPNDNTEQQQEEQANKNMLESKTIDARERKYLSNNIMSMLSWVVTSLQSDSEAAVNLLGEEYADDYIHMTREEIISKVTVSKLLGVVKELFYNPSNPENASFEYYIENPDIAENLQFVYDNWDAFVKNGYAKLIQLEGFTVTLNHPKEISQEDVDDAIKEALESGEITGNDNEYWQVGQRQISAKSSLSQAIKREFELLQVEDENSLGAKYGFPQFVDSNLAVESILKWCNNCLTIEEMEETLKSMVGNNPWVSSILEKLQDEPFRSLFFTNFRKDFTNYGAVTVTRDENGNRVFKSISINTDNAVRGFLNEVLRKYNNGDLSTIFTKQSENRVVANKANVKKILNQLNTIFSDIRNAHDNSRNNKSIFYAVARTKVKELQSILRAIGIDINDNAITQALVERQYNADFQSNPISTVTSELIQLFEAISKMDSPVNPFEQGEGGIGTNYSHILNAFRMYLPDSIESSVYEAGKMYYSYNVPSYTGKLFRKIQGENAQEFIEEEYGYTRFFKDNNGKWLCPWLNTLVGEKNARDNFRHKVQIDFNKIPYTDLGEMSYAQSMMTEYFSFSDGQYAWYRVPILSNKPSNEFIKFKRYSETQYKTRITKGFRSIAQQEIYRIQSIIQKTDPENVSESIKNYDINYGKTKDDPKYVNLADKLKKQELTFSDLVSNGKMRFNSSGARFHFLPMLNNEIINKTKLGQMLLDKINGKQVDEGEFISEFNTVISDAMDSIVAAEIANYEEIGLYDVDGKGNYINLPFVVKSAEVLASENGVKKRNFTVNGKFDEAAYNKALMPYRDEIRQGIDDKIAEYVWNDMFATMNIIELTTTDLAFYKNTEDFQKRFAQIHAPGMRLNISAKQTFGDGITTKVINGEHGKKLTLGGNYSDGKIRTMYISDQIVKSALYDDVREIFGDLYKKANTVEEKKRIEDMAKSILKAFEEVNVADAQGYSSPTSYRKKLAMQGKWDERMEQAYERIKSGDFNVDDLGIIWQPIKPFVFTNMNKTRGTDALSTMRVPMQNKNSEYMLLLAGALANAKKGSTLAAIFDFMEESAFDANGKYTGKGIDTIQFESAGKTGLMGVVDLNGLSYEEALNKLRNAAYLTDYSENTAQNLTGENYNTNFVHEYDAEDYSIQQEVPAHLLGHSQQMGSQMRILALTDFKDDDELNVKGRTSGKNLTAKEAKEEYFWLLAENVKDSFDKLSREVGGKTKLERNRNLEKILKEAILADQKYGSEMLDACTLNEETGEFNIPLDDPIQAIRIQQLLYSIIKSRINKQKIVGGPVVQVSNFGLRENLKVVFEGTGETKRVKHFECMVTCPSKELEEDLTVVENGKSRLLTIQEAIDRGIITEDNPLLKAIGYRIPTEDKYSMVPLKIVGFLPRSAGEGVMLPYDITTLSGSDFDIDKLYMMFKSVKKKEVTDWKKLEDDIMSSAKTNKKAKREEVKMAIDMIKNGNIAFSEDTIEMAVHDYYYEHKDRYTTLKYVEDTKLNTKEGRDNRIFDIQWGALTSHAVIDKMFNPGGFDIQKKAARISRILSEVGGYSYDQLSRKNIKELDAILEEKAVEKSILRPSTQIAFHKQNMTAGKLVGIFANNNTAHGFMSDMSIKLANIIPFKFDGIEVTNGMAVDNVLAKDGSYISKTIASFLAASVDAVKDPVLNDININTFTAGPAMVLARLGFDTDSIGLLMSQPIIKKLTSEFLARSNDGYVSAGDIVSDYLTERRLFGKALDSFKKTLSTEGFTKSDMAEWMSKDAPQDDQRDLSIVVLFSNLLDIATDLQEATFLTKFNSITNAAGPTIADTIVKKLRIERFFNKIDEGERNHLSVEAKNILKNNPILDAFHRYTIGKNGASDLLFENFFENSDRFMNLLTNIEKLCNCNLNADDINQIFNEYVLYRLTGDEVIDGSEEGRKKFINDFPARFAKEAKGQISNELIDAILNKAKDQRVPVDTLEVQTGSMTIDQKDAIANAWSVLINNPETKELAIDLFKYNLYRNGMAFSPMTFINLASVDVKQNVDGYVNTINSLITVDNEFTEDEDADFIFQFVRNHPNNKKFVSTVENFESMCTKNEDGTFTMNRDDGGMFYYSNGYMYLRDSREKNEYTKSGRLGIDYNFLEYNFNTFSHKMETVIGKANTEDDTSTKDDPNTIPETPQPKEKPNTMTQEDVDTLMGLMDAGEVMVSASVNNVDLTNDNEVTAFMLKQAKIEQKITTSEQVKQKIQDILEKYGAC